MDRIVKQWVREVSLRRGLSEALAAEQVALVCTCGSYRLCVHSPGADIDTLCVGPRHADRDADFFDALPPLLEASGLVTDVQAVRDANVPILKLKFDGVEIDLLYAQLALAAIPPEGFDITANEVLRNVDEKTVLSLGG